MKVLVRVDQVTALAQGIDAPNSTTKVEFDPKDLNQIQRETASNLFAAKKDNWSEDITVVSPTLAELKAGLDEIVKRHRQSLIQQEEDRQAAEARAARVAKLAIDFRKRALARDPSLLQEGSSSESGQDVFGQTHTVEYKGHYICIEDHFPKGTDPEPFVLRIIHLGRHRDAKTEAVLELIAASDQAVTEFAAWQKELTKASQLAESEAKTKLGRLVKASNKTASDFITKHGTNGDRLRLREIGLVQHHAFDVYAAKLLKDYPGSLCINATEARQCELSQLPDELIERFVQVRDHELIEGDQATPYLDNTGKGYACIYRKWVTMGVAVHLPLLVVTKEKKSGAPVQ